MSASMHDRNQVTSEEAGRPTVSSAYEGLSELGFPALAIDPSGHIAWANRHWETLLADLSGDSDETRFRNFLEFLARHSLQRFRDSDDLMALRAALSDDGTATRREIRCETRHGERHFLVEIMPRRFRQGRPAGAIATLTDITFLKHQVRDEQAFSGAASKELGQHLRRVGQFAFHLAEEAGSAIPVEMSDFLTRIQDEVGKMRTLLDNSLRYLHIDQEPLRSIPTDSERLVRSVLTFCQDHIDAVNGQVVVERLPMVMGNRELLFFVFKNLIENALHYRDGHRDPVVRISAVTHGEAVHFQVEDNGLGIPPDVRKRVFDPFNRYHPERHHAGVGIGLSLARKIIERHGGYIWADACEAGPGACIRFTLKSPNRLLPHTPADMREVVPRHR